MIEVRPCLLNYLGNSKKRKEFEDGFPYAEYYNDVEAWHDFFRKSENKYNYYLVLLDDNHTLYVRERLTIYPVRGKRDF